jgi:hypothetical protein
MNEEDWGVRRQLRAAAHIRLYNGMKWAAFFVVPILSIVSVIYTIWGPIWPTAPVMSFHDTVDASSTVLPFKITNRSLFFGINDMNITCGVDLFYFKDVNGLTGLERDESFIAPKFNIAAHSTNNFPCTATDYVRLRDDNSILIGFLNGSALATGPTAYRGPLTVIKMCLWISGNYTSLGIKHVFSSKMFQWPAAPGQNQWIEGPITPDLPNEAWIPYGSKMGSVWALRQLLILPWRDKFQDGALQCSQKPLDMTILFRPSK